MRLIVCVFCVVDTSSFSGMAEGKATSMYSLSDEMEQSLNEEIIKIMMHDGENTEEMPRAVAAINPPAQRPPEIEGLRRTPSPRSSPCPSPVLHRPFNTEVNGMKTNTLSPFNHIQQPPRHDHRIVKPNLCMNVANNKTTSVSSSKTNDISINSGMENSKIVGDRTKKSGSSTLSPSDVTSFQRRLFGLQQISDSRKCRTLPATSKITSWEKAIDAQQLNKPILSPATVTDSPFPPQEPEELQYIKVI